MIEIIDRTDTAAVTNRMKLEFAAISDNESFARMAVTAFITPLNPTLEELSDVKTAVSEAVTNAIIHGYENRGDMNDIVMMDCVLRGDVLEVEIIDQGVGMENVKLAMEPLYTSRPELDRSGMGFSFMEAFMDQLEVHSDVDCGTSVKMYKKIGTSPWVGSED